MPNTRVIFQEDNAIIFCEGSHQVELLASLGRTPFEVFVPPAAQWNSQVPDWLVEKQQNTVASLRRAGLQVVEVEEITYRRNEGSRM